MLLYLYFFFFFFSSRRRHTRFKCDWSSDVCSSDLFEPGDASNNFREKRYVMNYSSWISPGLFAPGFEDITALSHEVTESLNDPFVGSDGVHGITPWWLSQNGNCQNDLEVGDVIEGLPDATIAIRTKGRTYH